jgi:DNA polymerase-4
MRSRADDIAERGCTLVGISVNGLDDHPAQLVLPFTASSGTALDDAVDAVRDKYGSKAVRRAAQIGRTERAPMPILPD